MRTAIRRCRLRALNNLNDPTSEPHLVSPLQAASTDEIEAGDHIYVALPTLESAISAVTPRPRALPRSFQSVTSTSFSSAAPELQPVTRYERRIVKHGTTKCRDTSDKFQASSRGAREEKGANELRPKLGLSPTDAPVICTIFQRRGGAAISTQRRKRANRQRAERELRHETNGPAIPQS